MDVKDLKLYLKDNPKDIIRILKHFKFHSMHDVTGGIMCGKPNGDSDKSVSIKLDDNLTSSSFSISFSGDLFGMISETHDIEWYDVLYTSQLIIDKKIESSDEVDIFDGLLDSYKNIDKIEYLTYEEEILNDYEHIWNERFAKDHIHPKSQNKFEIMYCNKESRITIPWRDYEGKLIGIIGRANYDTDLRYFPIIPFQKKYHLYGLYQNKDYIRKTKTAYIGESEKFVMQLDSYNQHNAVAMGCSSLSRTQVELLIKCGCRNFILCHDEGSEKKTIKRNIEMIRDCMFMIDDFKIGIIVDRKNEIMMEGSKCSPSDLGKENWEKLKNNYIRWSK